MMWLWGAAGWLGLAVLVAVWIGRGIRWGLTGTTKEDDL